MIERGPGVSVYCECIWMNEYKVGTFLSGKKMEEILIYLSNQMYLWSSSCV